MAYIYDLTDTWNAGGTTFNAIKMNVTDMASASASKLVTLQTNGTEHFSVTKGGAGYFSGNVGIGTGSPGAKLHVKTATNVNHLFSFSGSSASYLAVNDAGSAYVDWLGYANTFQFYTASTERMRIDGSGNVGVNATPSAWVSSWRAVEVTTGGGALFGTLALSGIANNAYFDSGSNWRFKGSFGAATVSMASDGSVSINNSAAGTAGNIISFSTRVYVSPTGDVGVGTSSPSSRFHAAGITRVSDATNSTATVIDASTTAGVTTIISQFGGSELVLGSAATERMRLKANGQVRFFPLASAPASPQTGDVYYDSTTNKLRCYNGTTWNDLF
jgi:hypothetical protein